MSMGLLIAVRSDVGYWKTHVRPLTQSIMYVPLTYRVCNSRELRTGMPLANRASSKYPTFSPPPAWQNLMFLGKLTCELWASEKRQLLTSLLIGFWAGLSARDFGQPAAVNTKRSSMRSVAPNRYVH